MVRLIELKLWVRVRLEWSVATDRSAWRALRPVDGQT